MNRKLTTVLLLMSFLSVGYTVKAQTPQRLTLDEAIATAIKNNNGLKAADYELKAAKALSVAAFELPKLDVGLQYGQYSSIQRDNSWSVSQTIPFPTLFIAQKQLANSTVKGKELQKDISVLELKNMVRTYFYQILFLENNRRELNALDSLYADFVRIASVRYQTGDTRKVDIGTAEVKRGEIALMIRQNEQYIADAYSLMQVILNTDHPFEITSAHPYQPLTIEKPLIDSAAIRQHPSVRQLYQEAEVAARNKRVEVHQALPDLTFGYTNQSLIGNHNINGVEQYVGNNYRFRFISVGVSVPLSLWATGSKIKALEHQKQSALHTAHRQVAQMKADIDNALGRYHRAMERYRYFIDKALPNAKEMADNAKVGYNSGEIGYLEYLYALQTVTDVKLNYLNTINEVNQSVINYYLLTNQ